MHDARIGDNGGPLLEDENPGEVSWKGYIWRRKHKAAWKTPPREIALRQQQYEYYRDLLLRFPKPAEAAEA